MMRRVFAVIVLVCAGHAFSQDFGQKIAQARQQGRLSETDALYLSALRAYAPDRLPPDYQGLKEPVMKSGFALGFKLRHDWARFSKEQQEVLGSFLQRPESDTSIVSPSGLFRVHYDTAGYHAVSMEDFDHSGIPDYIEEAADAVDYVYQVEVGQIGMRAPPDDQGRGGSDEWDIYIREVGSGLYGWTFAEYPPIGTDPARYICYIVLDNNYGSTPTKGMNGLRVTAAHEFFHMIQLGYNGRDDDDNGWFDDLYLMEAGSTWMEDAVFDHINDYLNYLDDFFARSNVRFDYSDGWREYGLCLWYHFLEKRFNTRSFMPKTWQYIVNDPGLKATDRMLEDFGSSFENELPLFYAWNYMTGSHSDTTRFYPEGNLYPEMALSGTYALQRDTSVTDTLYATGARYIQFRRGGESMYTFVPSYTDWSIEATRDGCTILVGEGAGWPRYADLGDGTRALMTNRNLMHWGCYAVVELHGLPSELVPIEGVQDIEELDRLNCFPNPFIPAQHSAVMFPFLAEGSGTATLSIFTTSGKCVYEAEQNAEPGANVFYWNGQGNEGGEISGGIYLYFVTLGGSVISKDKLAVIR